MTQQFKAGDRVRVVGNRHPYPDLYHYLPVPSEAEVRDYDPGDDTYLVDGVDLDGDDLQQWVPTDLLRPVAPSSPEGTSTRRVTELVEGDRYYHATPNNPAVLVEYVDREDGLSVTALTVKVLDENPWWRLGSTITLSYMMDHQVRLAPSEAPSEAPSREALADLVTRWRETAAASETEGELMTASAYSDAAAQLGALLDLAEWRASRQGRA